jgi:hypothetical protein
MTLKPLMGRILPKYFASSQDGYVQQESDGQGRVLTIGSKPSRPVLVDHNRHSWNPFHGKPPAETPIDDHDMKDLEAAKHHEDYDIVMPKKTHVRGRDSSSPSYPSSGTTLDMEETDSRTHSRKA